LHITTARESDSVTRVSESTDRLPTDIEVLKVRLAMVLAERDAAIAERDQALSQNDRLRHLLQQLQRMQFGSRSEKLDPDQLALAGGRAPRRAPEQEQAARCGNQSLVRAPAYPIENSGR